MESGFEARAQRASSTSDERRGECEDWTKVSGGLVKVKRQASSKRPATISQSQRLFLEPYISFGRERLLLLLLLL